jgi:hypothetical protein
MQNMEPAIRAPRQAGEIIALTRRRILFKFNNLTALSKILCKIRRFTCGTSSESPCAMTLFMAEKGIINAK